MKYFVALIVAIVCGFLSYSTLDREIAAKIRIYHLFRSTEEFESKIISKKKNIIVSILVLLITFVCSVKIMQDATEIINIAKMLAAMCCITGAACNDYREKRIPNFFPLVLTLVGILLLVAGVFFGQNGAMSYIISSVFATVGVAMCMTIAAFLTKGGIGAGDIKMLSALAIVGGVYTVCGTLFFSMATCAIVAVYFLITKKKTLKESLPFGPFMFIGYTISIMASIY